MNEKKMNQMQDGRKGMGKRTQKEGRQNERTSSTKKGSEARKARKQTKQIQRVEDSLNGLKLTVIV